MAISFSNPVGGTRIGGSAPVAFGTAAVAAPANADVLVEWDLDNDGDYTSTEENITTYVMALETTNGREFPSGLTGVPTAGQLRATLHNPDGRFSLFNTASPLNTAPFSTDVGRRIRVRTSTSVPDDPVLLARDRFRRDGTALGVTETGQAWTPRAGFFTTHIAGYARAGEMFGSRIIETVDVGQANQFVQCTLRQLQPSNARQHGLVVRFTDTSNYTIVRYDGHRTTPQVEIIDRDAAVDTTLATFSIRAWEGMTLGASVIGTTVTAYIGGVPIASGTTGNATGNHCGLHAEFNDFTGRHPEIGDFYVWDRVPTEPTGIIWTGTVTKVTPGITVGDVPTATLEAEGVLADAARAKVGSPRLAITGAPTGLVVGDILSRAGLLHPPGPIKAGTVTTGTIGVEDETAFALARSVEQIERGHLHETGTGRIGYHDRASRTTASLQAWFTDTPGLGQYPFSAIAPVDHKGQIINKVTAGVAPDAPSGITVTQPSGVTSVAITMPTVDPGNLLVVFIANSMNTSGEQWLVPIWWVSHRDAGSDYGVRVYSHICDGAEGGTTVTFYANGGAQPGLWVAQIYRIREWYGSYNNGIAMSEVARGGDAHQLVHGWGRGSTMFIVCRSGLGASPSTMVFSANTDPPDGYQEVTGIVSSSGNIALDVGLMSTHKVDCTEHENPTILNGLTNAITDESLVFAIRGFDGAHTKATLDDPRTTGGEGRFVTREDVASQLRHNVVRSHEAPALFRSESDAQGYCDSVLAEYAGDRPIFTLSFWASSSNVLRDQALARKVGDKITVTATGATNLGVERHFFIEHVVNNITNGGKLWQVTWQLSPA